MERLQGAVKKIVNFRYSYEPGPGLTAGSRSPDLTKFRNLRRLLHMLPPPGFLTLSILETLRSTDFGPYACVVPGEADAYCADYVRRNGGIILTNDSDLLVHDLGVDGSVIFLNDIAFPVSSNGAPLKCSQFHPREIAKRLGLRNIIQLACAMKETYRFSQSLEVARGLSIRSPRYIEFSTQFNILLPHSELSTWAQTHGLDGVLRWLDARVSEFVHKNAADLLPHPQDDTSQTERLHRGIMYLPVLLEDPKKASVWTCGSRTRRMGYSLFCLHALDRRVNEIRRRDIDIVQAPMTLLDPLTLARNCTSLLDELDIHFQRFAVHPGLDSKEVWRIYGVKMISETAFETGKSAPLVADAMRLLTSEHSLIDSWAQIHLEGQLQAALYSMRILKQLIDVFLAFVPANLQELEQELIRIVTRLQVHLNTLPPLETLFSSHINLKEEQEKHLELAIQDLYKSLGMEIVPEKDLLPKQDRKKRNKKDQKGRTRSKQNPGVKGTTSSNMYNVLETDDS